MKVTFKAENGMCPYFIHGDTKYYIQDRCTSGRYEYSLYSKKLACKIEQFDSPKEALAFAESKKGVKWVCEYGKRALYSTILHNYIVDGKQVTITPTSTPLSGNFDTYADCLEFAKEYVSTLIDQQQAFNF